MKRIAVFCDGTWNRPENDEATHVARLAFEIPDRGPDGVAQVAQYFEGVGSGRGTTRLGRMIDQYGGGAFGWGLNAKIKAAYRWIAERYEPRDALYIFGFSRGAYTARSLGGLIRASGIPTRDTIGRIDEAFDRYRDRRDATHPNTDESAAFRWSFAPHVHTGEQERLWRRRHGHPEGTPLKIAYLGIWDTVGALGVPGVFGVIARPFNAKYLFHDAKLSRSVCAGRHALATDERRLFYPPTVWQNLAELNGDAADAPIRQEWFPGDHGMVGGSGRDRQVGEYAMAWIIEGAKAAGLHVSPAFEDHVAQGRRFGGALSNRRRRRVGRDRRITEHSQDVSDCALHRLAFGGADGAAWDPPTLRPLRARLASRIPRARDPLFP